MSTTVTPPKGAHFAFEEVKTAKGTQSLGTDLPILVWDDLDGCIEHYGAQGVVDILDGTSLRTSMQGIARRLKAAGKSDDEIAQAQISFKPGKRQGGSSTPTSRARKAAEAAAEKVGGDAVARLLERLASGEITEEQLSAVA